MIRINEISTIQADMIKSFAVFYLILIGSYVSDSVITCYQRQTIHNNRWLQLFLVFFLFYFLVTLFSNTGNLECVSPMEKLWNTFFYFIGFLVVMRLDIKVTAIVIFLIFIIYFIELNKDFYSQVKLNTKHNCDEKQNYWFSINWPIKVNWFPINMQSTAIISKLETVIYYLIIVLLVIGFISYGGEVKDSIKKNKNISWIEVVTDAKACNLTDRKGFWEYFKSELSLKI